MQFPDRPHQHYYQNLISNDMNKIHIKRPKNAFFIWSTEARKHFSAKYTNYRNHEISKLLGQFWNEMNEENKRPYFDKAREERILHLKTYPDYTYCPIRKRKSKKSFKKPLEIPSTTQNVEFATFDKNIIQYDYYFQNSENLQPDIYYTNFDTMEYFEPQSYSTNNDWYPFYGYKY
ncbi:transcription factor SOX-10-like [Octopus sinensis]|uniref:Sex-determining region Y protein n=1 Tax=Octopus sinensis TaxID=2607531 RepID=A0A6P7TXS7_9MOLL|nr:transcription factor SOX-10-like [Octopus sinensis]XP_029656568.1 transcription factor SOX-10-like [Octopus sinensis]